MVEAAVKRVGIVGAGAIGLEHARRWKQLPVELVGFHNRTRARAEAAAQQFGVSTFEDLKTLIENVDIVTICSATPAHLEAVTMAAEAGKAIVCEKPLGRTVAECEAMVAVCDAAHVPLFIAHVLRFFPLFAETHEIVESGKIGAATHYHSVRAGHAPFAEAPNWFGDLSLSGGVTMDMGVHDIDYARWVMGEIVAVTATSESEGLLDSLLQLEFSSGATGDIELSWRRPAGEFYTRFQIQGTKGEVIWDADSENWPVDTSQRIVLQEEPNSADPYLEQLAHFLESLESEQPFSITPFDGLMAVKVAEAALFSIVSGERIAL